MLCFCYDESNHTQPENIFIGCFYDGALEDVKALCCEMNLKSFRQGDICHNCYCYGLSKPCYLNPKDYKIYKRISKKILADMDPLYWGNSPQKEGSEIDIQYLTEEMMYS